MTYYRIRYTATVYTKDDAGDPNQMEENIEASFEDVLYQLFYGDAYNVCCEVEKRRVE